MEYEHVHHEEEGSSWGIVGVIVVFVILIIIGFIIFFLVRDTSTTVGPIYTFTGTSSAATDTFLADNFTLFTTTAPVSGMTLTITAPTSPIGKQFIIDNSSGVGVVTLSGVTVSTTLVYAGVTSATPPVPVTNLPASKIQAHAVAQFIWKTTGSVVRVS